LILQSRKIDAGFIQSSARFDSLDTQTQKILVAITDTKESLSHDLFEFLTRLICRSEAVNKAEHQEIRQMTTPSAVDGITAQIEMLSVGRKEEQLLQRTIQKILLKLLQYPYMTGQYEQLTEAHPETFDWIFCNSDEWEFPWTNFEKWLRYS
jgi:predicted CoA-binding protein